MKAFGTYLTQCTLVFRSIEIKVKHINAYMANFRVIIKIRYLNKYM